MGKKGENIYKRKDGRWEARYIKEYALNGKVRYGYCYGKTYREAKEKVNYARSMLFVQKPAEKGDYPKYFSAYCNEWLILKRSKVKESTYIKYETILTKHIKPKLGNFIPEMLSEIAIEQFAHELLKKNQLSTKTVRDILSVLHAVLDYTKRQNPHMNAVVISYPSEKFKEKRVLTKAEQGKFVRYLKTEMDTCKFGVLLALLTGLRIGEICALRWSDISLDEQVLYVRHSMQRLKTRDPTRMKKTKVIIGMPKSEHSVRKIPLNKDILELCLQWKPTSAFDGCKNLKEITFTGNAPKIATDAFREVKATCYYPKENITYVSSVTGEQLTQYAYTKSGTEEKLQLYGSSLILNENTTIRMYYQLKEGEITSYKFTIDGQEVVPQKSEDDGLYYVDLNNIAAQDLEVTHTFTAGNIKVTNFSALSYVNIALKYKGTKEANRNAAAALYLYWEAAERYFNNK